MKCPKVLVSLVTPALTGRIPPSGGPSPAPLHPKRSPTSTGDTELKEERMPGRKASCSAVGSGSRGLPPSSPMVSSAHNPNKAEIPERRKDSTSTPVSGLGWGLGVGGMDAVPTPLLRSRPQPQSVPWASQRVHLFNKHLLCVHTHMHTHVHTHMHRHTQMRRK